MKLLDTLNGSHKKILRSRAPMRISFAGGGTELSPYMESFGGKVMNATISLFAHTALVPRKDRQLHFSSTDFGTIFQTDLEEIRLLDLNGVPGGNRLAVAAVQHLISNFEIRFESGFDFVTYSDAPVGSGLGASSTMTVAIVDCLFGFAGKNVDPYSLASIAHEIERAKLGLAGGLQDQFCAAFGGFNFMEFGPEDHILINPLRLQNECLFDLESSLLLVDTGTSRESANLIEKQTAAMTDRESEIYPLLQSTASNAVQMKEAILKGEIEAVGSLLTKSWELKKRTLHEISNSGIDELFSLCVEHGALGGKLSGAGGGGYLLIVCPPENRSRLIGVLEGVGKKVLLLSFTNFGSRVWYSSSSY